MPSATDNEDNAVHTHKEDQGIEEHSDTPILLLFLYHDPEWRRFLNSLIGTASLGSHTNASAGAALNAAIAALSCARLSR